MSKQTTKNETGSAVHKINASLRMLMVPIEQLHEDKSNARRHAKRDLEVLAGSLSEHGQQKPIVVLADGKIIAGNGTFAAAKSLGWTHLAVVTYDSEDAAKAAAFAIIDNRSAELSEWDYEALTKTISTLDSEMVKRLGFNEHELAPLLAATWSPADIGALPVRPSGKHLLAFEAEEWAAIEKAVEYLSRARGEQLRPVDVLVELARKALTQPT